MFFVLTLTALLLLAAFVGATVQAVGFLQRHPEITGSATPRAYQLCHVTLAQVVERYHHLKPAPSPPAAYTWHSPDGRRYHVAEQGVEMARGAGQPAYRLGWERIGGVGIRMQPGFRFSDANRDGVPDNQYTTDYSFHLLIVPTSGATIDVTIPLHDRDAAVTFIAHTLALAERRDKRINTFGFDKPPTAYRKRISKF